MDLMKTLMVYLLLLTAGAADGTVKALPATPTPVPAATPYVVQSPVVTQTPEITYTALRPGDRGENVLRMQTRLQDLGYLPGALDGIYGKNTQRALESFQADHQLSVDGLAGPNTLKALYAPLPTSTPVPTSTLVPTSTPVPAPTAAPAAQPAEAAESAPSPAPAQAPTEAAKDARDTEAPEAPKETDEAQDAPVSPLAAIHVAYIDQQSGEILYQTEMPLDGNTTVYADNHNIQGAYKLCSPGAVTVDTRSGAAVPGEVIFYYIPDTVAYTLICADEAGTVLHAETVLVSRGESAELAPEWNAAREGWQPAGESSVSVTAGAEGKDTPDPIVFTYRKLPAVLPNDSLLPEGSQIMLAGEAYALPWYIDGDGIPYLCLTQLASAVGWPLENQRYAINGQEVTFIADGDALVSLTVQDASFAENALLWEGSLYVDQVFLQALGFTVSVEGAALRLDRAE